MLGELFSALGKGLLMLGRFLLVVSVGLLVVLVFVLPWIIRVASVVAWLAGAYIAAETLNQVYGPMTETIPLMMLWVIPSILAAAVPVWMFYKGLLPWIWGGFFLYGLLGFGFRKCVIMLLAHWSYADLFFRVAPVMLLTTLVFYISIRLKLMRMKEVMPI